MCYVVSSGLPAAGHVDAAREDCDFRPMWRDAAIGEYYFPFVSRAE